jgi:hypothetical protein
VEPTLQKARQDALTAFGLTSDYAETVTDLAKAALALDLKELAGIAQEVTSLEGPGAQLSTPYRGLTDELQMWATSNPKGATLALAQIA